MQKIKPLGLSLILIVGRYTFAKSQKKELMVFLDYPIVEMTNNLAERTVKPFVIDRKNFLFSDTEKGAEASAAAMTIIETAKRNNLDVYGYLLYLLTTLPASGKNSSEESLTELLPWSDSLPDYCKAQYSKYYDIVICSNLQLFVVICIYLKPDGIVRLFFWGVVGLADTI